MFCTFCTDNYFPEGRVYNSDRESIEKVVGSLPEGEEICVEYKTLLTSMFHVTRAGFALMEQYYGEKYRISLSYVDFDELPSRLEGKHLSLDTDYWGLIIEPNPSKEHVVPILVRRLPTGKIEALLADSIAEEGVERYRSIAPSVAWGAYLVGRQASYLGCAIDALVFLKDALRRDRKDLEALFARTLRGDVELPKDYSLWVGKMMQCNKNALDLSAIVLRGSKPPYTLREHLEKFVVKRYDVIYEVDPVTLKRKDLQKPLYWVKGRHNVYLSSKGAQLQESVQEHLALIEEGREEAAVGGGGGEKK